MEEIRQLTIIGDSSVYGWGDIEEGGWCERLRKQWMAIPSAPVIYPLGVRGDGLEKIAKRWEQEWSARGELRRKVPDGILLSVGINDTAKVGSAEGRPQLSSEAYSFGLTQLLSQIRKKTNVLVMGLTAVDEEVMPFANCLWYSNKANSIYETKIEEVCLELNIPFLPLLREMLSEENWLQWIEPDGIHLNSDGHFWVYQKIMRWDALLKWAHLEKLENLTI